MKFYFDYGKNASREPIKEIPVPDMPSPLLEMMEVLRARMNEICGLSDDDLTKE
jgi:hypothetical protein